MATAVLAGRSRPAREWLGAVLALLFAAAPALYWGGRVLDEEAVGFLRKNWGERGALREIFDVRGYDFYQGRELSYAIDYLDAQWLRLLASHDVLLFVPPSAVLASLAFVAIGLFLLPRALPRLDAATRWLALLVLLSNFVCLTTMGLLYRATKPLVAPMLLGLLLLALAEQREPRLGRRAAFGVSFLLSLGMSLLDRQGLFYVLVLVLALAASWVFSRRGLPLALGAAAGALCWYAYFATLAPPLIHALEGYWPRRASSACASSACGSRSSGCRRPTCSATGPPCCWEASPRGCWRSSPRRAPSRGPGASGRGRGASSWPPEWRSPRWRAS